MLRGMLASRTVLLLMVGIGLIGCGGGDERHGEHEPEACPPPNRVVNERCLEPGVQDDGCPAGTLGLEDGTCQPAGVPPEMCPEGWVHDGDAACEPILPAAPCPPGQMALPGDTSCHPVMDCGSGKWGNIPIDGTTVYVDAAYTSGAGVGSETQPFTNISAGVAAAGPGALVAVAAGTYDEDVLLDKPLRLWGVCPDLVSLVGQGGSIGAIDIRPGANGTEVAGLAITTSTNAAAVGVSGVENVSLDRLWIHDASGRGINVQSDLGATSMTVRETLVERNRVFGVFVAGSQATLARVVVRDTLPHQSDETDGVGIGVVPAPETGTASTVTVAIALVERNHQVGVFVEGSHATLDGVVVRDTLPPPGDPAGGRGINVEPNPETGAPSMLALTGALIERNRGTGLFVQGSEANLTGAVVRDTVPQASDQRFGRGIQVQLARDTSTPSTFTLTAALIERNHDVGVLAFASLAMLYGVVVRDTQPKASDLTYGRGIEAQWDPDTLVPSTLGLTGALVERNHDVGIVVVDSEAALAGVIVRDTLVEATNQGGGRGINVQASDGERAPSALTLTGALIERNRTFGVVALDAHAALLGSVVRETLTRGSDGLFGDGIAFIGVGETAGAVIESTASENNARAGLSNFGGHATLLDVALRCNAIDLVGEPGLDQQPFDFDDAGGNICGCSQTGPCTAITAGLAPPEPINDER